MIPAILFHKTVTQSLRFLFFSQSLTKISRDIQQDRRVLSLQWEEEKNAAQRNRAKSVDGETNLCSSGQRN